ncbi:hypothetical protein ACIOHE_20800 [Streptomyces sp. NPDC087851]|uniref:hypothetical protein n=1 Tax=Streptomyces sp. NPDC087851 TaxID=3365810 RepID=UPI00381F94F9
MTPPRSGPERDGPQREEPEQPEPARQEPARQDTAKPRVLRRTGTFVFMALLCAMLAMTLTV